MSDVVIGNVGCHLYMDERHLLAVDKKRQSGAIFYHCVSDVFCQCCPPIVYLYEYQRLHREKNETTPVVGIHSWCVEFDIMQHLHSDIWIQGCNVFDDGIILESDIDTVGDTILQDNGIPMVEKKNIPLGIISHHRFVGDRRKHNFKTNFLRKTHRFGGSSIAVCGGVLWEEV